MAIIRLPHTGLSPGKSEWWATWCGEPCNAPPACRGEGVEGDAPFYWGSGDLPMKIYLKFFFWEYWVNTSSGGRGPPTVGTSLHITLIKCSDVLKVTTLL